MCIQLSTLPVPFIAEMDRIMTLLLPYRGYFKDKMRQLMENILQKKSSIYNIGAGWLILKSRGLCNIGFSKQKLPSLALLTTPAANVAK